MNDDPMTLIDARGRDAGAALKHAAALRPQTASAPARPAQWQRPVLAVSVLVAVVVGLVWVSDRRVEPAENRDPAGLRYVLGDAPVGWTAERAQDADDALISGPLATVRISVFGTRGDAIAPVLKIVWQDPTRESDVTVGGIMTVAGLDNLREIKSGGTVAACGDLGSSLSCVLNTSNGTVQSISTHLTDSDVGRLLNAVQFVDGETIVQPSALPAGMALLAQGGWDQMLPVLWAPTKVPGASHVDYTASNRQKTLVLVTGWANENDLAGAGAWGDMQSTRVGGQPAFIGVNPVMNWKGLFWTEGDRAFALVASDTSLDLVSAAASVRPATTEEWDEIVVSDPPITDFTTPVDGTSLTEPDGTAPAAPAETDPPILLPASVEVRDVSVVQTVRPITDFDAGYSSDITEGPHGEVQIAVVANTVIARDESRTGGSTSKELDGTVFTEANYLAVDGNTAVVAMSTDPSVRQLRVTCKDGIRYILNFVAVENQPDLKVAVIVLPPANIVTFDVVDANGNVIMSRERP